MSDQIQSVLKEARVFPPPEEYNTLLSVTDMTPRGFHFKLLPDAAGMPIYVFSDGELKRWR